MQSGPTNGYTPHNLAPHTTATNNSKRRAREPEDGNAVLYVAEAEEPLPKTIVLYLRHSKRTNATDSPIIGLTGKDWSFDQFGTIFAMGLILLTGRPYCAESKPILPCSGLSPWNACSVSLRWR
ncbi:hypothetical protein VNO80_25035 [Phaseolus coccineus]|uniref:Uncharacterized protein n=1 Tax=Phaseolus coccineus TaxID=3886 RepID=A0AAN9QNL1_PHACN